MTAATQYVARRATMEDLPQLLVLWRLEQLPAEALEKRFTEFQVVTDEAEQLLAAVGMQIVGTQGLLHSESIAQPELSDTFRELIWNRLQVLIANHALERLWTQMNGPFWRDKGFESASAEQAATVPAAFHSEGGAWFVKTLRAANANAALEREFAQLKALQQEEAERMRQRVQWAKRIALGISVAVFLLVVLWAMTMVKFGPKMFHH